MTIESGGASRRPTPLRYLFVPILLGALVALGLGVLAKHEAIAPGAYPGSYIRLFFSDSLYFKAWFATAAFVLALLQPLSAASMFGRLGLPRPRWIAAFHRWNGRVVLLLTLPVAYHCIFRIGFQDTTGRVAAHALLGCALYGAFVAKIMIVRWRRFATWAIATAGTVLLVVLAATWYTSAVYLFRTAGFHR
jgi:Family of unknown function (DUF6529)